MGEDINYDSFGFIVIRLMHADVGYRGRRWVLRARAKFSNYRHKCILMSDQPASPSLRFHSAHLVSLINFVLRLLSATRLSLRFHRADCPLSRSSLSNSFISALAFLPPRPISDPLCVFRFSFLSIRNPVLCVNIVRQSKDTWRALLRRSRF